jgi:hypothetical protein
VNALPIIMDHVIAVYTLPFFVFLHEWGVDNRFFTPTLTGNLNEHPIVLKHCNLQNVNETFYN